MKTARKPKRPLPGRPSKQWGCYETERVCLAGLASLGAVTANILDTVATQGNMDALYNLKTYSGLIGAAFVIGWTAYRQWKANNIRKQ